MHVSRYGIDQQRVRKGLAQPRAWHAGDATASPEPGRGMRGSLSDSQTTSVARQARPLSARMRTRAHGETIGRSNSSATVTHLALVGAFLFLVSFFESLTLIVELSVILAKSGAISLAEAGVKQM